MFSGNLVDLGLYDQCIAIEHELDSENYIKGRYCYSGLVVPFALFQKQELSEEASDSLEQIRVSE